MIYFSSIWKKGYAFDSFNDCSSHFVDGSCVVDVVDNIPIESTKLDFLLRQGADLKKCKDFDCNPMHNIRILQDLENSINNLTKK